MRTRMLRLTATAGATALLAGIGALATAGSASAATAPTGQARTSVVASHVHNDHECCWRWTPAGWVWCCDFDHDWDHDHDGLVVGGLINVIL